MYVKSKYQPIGKGKFTSNGWSNYYEDKKIHHPVSVGQVTAWIVTIFSIGYFIFNLINGLF